MIESGIIRQTNRISLFFFTILNYIETKIQACPVRGITTDGIRLFAWKKVFLLFFFNRS